MALTPQQHEMLVRVDERTAVLVIKTKDQETRLRSLERWRSWMVGAAAAAGGAGAYVKSLFLPNA